ncbi:MAG: hypothetical protein KBB86_00785 [Candidatus Pacebacteria bacterium]|nr:hypothetical protein [Candidatus Paceibacterota bacterium]
MQDEQKNQDQVVTDLEEAYKQTISSSGTTTNTTNSSLSDEKQKINELALNIDSLLINKKSTVEKKLLELKALKTEIEEGLEDLKKTEAKKATLQAELTKIEKIEQEQKQIESEVANISSQI